MPTLVWVRRRRSGTSGAGAGGRVSASAAAAAPDPAVSAAAVSASSAAAVQVALPNVSGKKKRKLKLNHRVEAATATKKEPEETDDETSALKAETDDEDTNVLKEETDGEEEAEEIEASLPKSSRRKQPSRKEKNDISNANDEDQDSLSLGSESEEYGSNNETLSNQHADGRKTKRNAHGGKKKKRKKNPRANAGTSVKKISKAASDQDLPNGVRVSVAAAAAAVPDSAVSASSAAVQVALSVVSTKQKAGRKKTNRKRIRVNAATTAKKRSKATSGRDLPTTRGVHKKPSGKFQSRIKWGGKNRSIGTFDTPEQASAAYMSARKDLDDAKVRPCAADEVDAIFDAAQTKALEAVGGKVPKKRKSKTSSKRDLPRGVHTLSSGHFQSVIWWGNKQRHIGTFDSPEQASAAYMSARKDLDDANVSALGADEKDAIFDAAKKKTLELFGGFVPEERDLPTGVYKLRSGKFASRIRWGGKQHHIGTFDTPEQASAAYISAKNDFDTA